MHLRTLTALLILLVVIMAGCSPASGDPAAALLSEADNPHGLVLPNGFIAQVLVEDLSGPTQIVKGPNGKLWVAQLASSEKDGAGEVLVIDLESGKRVVVASGLRKPTGIALVGGYLWIATERDLVRIPVDERGATGPAMAVLEDLPFDGRSNGTLTLTPNKELLYETSGVRFGGSPLDDSATLWQLDPAMPEEQTALATGLKGAYAHTFHGEDGLWITEISHDPVNGKPPPDELNFLRLTGGDSPDFGWPKCFGNREPAHNYGGDVEGCLSTQPPVLLFNPHATPTSIVLSPWEHNVLLVALWGKGEIVRIPVEYDGDSAAGTVEPFVDGLSHPQHLLVWDNDTLLVSDHERGEVIAISHAADG